MFTRIKRFIEKRIFKKSGLSFRRKRRRVNKQKIKGVFIFLVEIIATAAFAYFVVICFGKQVECSTDSMAPTYDTEDTVLINTIAYSFSTPKAGDVIAFKPKSNVNASYSIKRVVALPGDTVLISKGRLYVNGEIANFSSKDYIEDAGIVATEYTIPEGEYFVLGDNRNESEDSRYETIGNVSLDDILGKVWIKYPF